jgi:hypothetical protein
MMKYGLTMASAGVAGEAHTMGKLAHIAEESGWDGIFLEDYIIWQSHADVPTYDPWITLAAMAIRTQRIRLGTMVTPIARRRPWKLAQELMTLDHLSNGWMILGVGLGDTGESILTDSSFANFGENWIQRSGHASLTKASKLSRWPGVANRFPSTGNATKFMPSKCYPNPSSSRVFRFGWAVVIRIADRLHSHCDGMGHACTSSKDAGCCLKMCAPCENG